MVRGFFLLCAVVELVFIYAAVFDRDLPRRMAEWFFGALSGERVKVAAGSAEDEGPTVWNWVIFAVVCAVPPVAWIVFEVIRARG